MNAAIDGLRVSPRRYAIESCRTIRGLVAFRTRPPSQSCARSFGLLAKGHGVRQLVGPVAADSGVALIPLLEASSIEVLRRFVTSGLGVTFLPKFSVVTELERGEVKCVPLTDSLLVQASAHLIVRAQRRLPTSVDRLVGFLSQEMTAFRKAT